MEKFKLKILNLKPSQPIDRVALTLILVLLLLIGLLVGSGDRTKAKVRDFSWQNKQIGANDSSFMLTFSRLMDSSSVEANLHIAPPLPGKFSWVGRRMTYTLTIPPRYETNYKLELQNVRDKFTGRGKLGKQIEPFIGQFRTRDRIFIYLGIEGEEKGRLILYNITQKQKTILTPKDWVVINFEPYPAGDRILFSATDWLNYGPGSFEQQIYTVTTGRPSLPASPADTPPKAGIISKVLDSEEYQNLEFDLSPDGQIIVVRRVKRSNLRDSGLWVLRPSAPAQPLKNPPGGKFLIAPDSASLALSLPDGVAILPLTPSVKPLGFMPQFGRVLDFAADGVRAAMVKFNSDSTQSIFLVTNQGRQKELIRTTGDRLSCQFDPSSPNLYCLVTNLLPGKKYQEQQNLTAIDLNTFKITPLLEVPNRRDIQMSLSPDGLEVLFDRVVTKEGLPKKDELTTDVGSAIASGHILLLPLSSLKLASSQDLKPEQLSLSGFHPRWLP